MTATARVTRDMPVTSAVTKRVSHATPTTPHHTNLLLRPSVVSVVQAESEITVTYASSDSEMNR